MTEENRLPLLRAYTSQIAERALVVGDPKRAEMCANLLDEAEEIGYFREYRTFTGTYQGTPVTICSHGVGGPGAAIAFHELFLGGVKIVLRAGTCGALQLEIQDGELVIPSAAVRLDGASQGLIPLEYPAITHHQVINALFAACEKNQLNTPHSGIVLTSANFYPGLLQDSMSMWMQAGLVAVEMEIATLLVMASLRGLRAGGVLVTDGNLARDQAQVALEDFAYNPHREIVKHGTQKMLQVALDALVNIA